MSNNPKTKAYQRRVKRLGRAFQWQLEFKTIAQVVADLDPKASSHLVTLALRWAISDHRKSQLMFMKAAEDYSRRAGVLESLQQARRLPPLQVVGGIEA